MFSKGFRQNLQTFFNDQLSTDVTQQDRGAAVGLAISPHGIYMYDIHAGTQPSSNVLML